METGFFFSLILDPVEDSHWVLSGQIGEKDAISKSVTGFPGGSDGKASAYNAGDPDLIPGSGRSPGKGNGNPLQYSCLENPMEGGAWWATVHGVAKSWTRLSDFTFTVLLGSCFIKLSRVIFINSVHTRHPPGRPQTCNEGHTLRKIYTLSLAGLNQIQLFVT